MSFKPGDIAYLKTTGEKVVVLDNGKTVMVRRPIASKENGLRHAQEEFYAVELETFETQLAREFKDMQLIEAHREQLASDAKTAKQTPTLVN